MHKKTAALRETAVNRFAFRPRKGKGIAQNRRTKLKQIGL